MTTRFGVAFGSGGSRGAAHLGALKVLRRAETTHPEIVAGTSIGAVIAAFYAAGMTQDAIDDAVHNFDWLGSVVNLNQTIRNLFRTTGLVSNKNVRSTIEELIGTVGFEDLPVDFAITAADYEKPVRIIFTSPAIAERMDPDILESFLPEPGDGLPGCPTRIITDVDVALAVQATCAVPGFFSPVKIGEYKLQDGGVFTNIPVDIVRSMGANVTLGIGLGLPFYPRRFRGAGTVMGARIGLEGVHQQRKSLDMADLGFEIEDIGKTSFVKKDSGYLISLGETAMERRLNRLKELLKASHDRDE